MGHEPFLPPSDGKENVNLINPRDLMINLVAKALDTGYRKEDVRPSERDMAFFSGRVTAFIYSASTAAHMLYGVDFEWAKRILKERVNEARRNWPPRDLRNTEKVGNESDAIVTQLLESVW